MTRARYSANRFILSAVFLFSSLFVTAESGPLPVRNLSPVAQLYGLPRATDAEVLEQGYELTFATEIANNFSSGREGSAYAFYDGETLIMSYMYRRALGEGLEFSVEVPYVMHHGGTTDAFIDGFHDALKLRDGGRELARRNQIDYFIRLDGTTYADFQKDRGQLGDLRAAGAYQLHRGDDYNLTLNTQLKLPTGKVRNLSGSQGWDLALWASYSGHLLLEDLNLSLNAGVTYLGEGELAPEKQNSWVGFGHLGLQYSISQRISLLGQLDGHSELIHANLDQLGGPALQGSIGVRFQFTPQFRGDFGVVEDLKSNSASDVVFQVMISARL